MTIRIVNVRDLLVPHGKGKRAVFPDESYVWVGRQNGRWGLRCSPLHNPFRVGKSPWNGASFLLTRTEAVALYRMYFRDRGGSEEEELDRLRSLYQKHGRLTLVCACAPKPCHAEEIRRVLLEGLT